MMNITSLKSQIARRNFFLLHHKIVHAVLIVSFVVTYFVTIREIPTTARRTTSEDSYDDRPVMHTFYEKVRSGEDDLLEAWKEEWTIAGFEAKVLTLEDSKKHFFFPVMEDIVKPMFDDGYDAMCFYRWLAMAASGGGWMSDYDTFPTNFPMNEAKRLPTNGKLTSFEVHVPSLVSGNADEWSRIAQELIKYLPQVKEEIKSDMHAFQVIREHAKKIQVDFRGRKANIKEGFLYKKAINFNSDSPREVDCEAMAIGRAVHFAHLYTAEALERGMFPLPNVTNYREATHRRGEAARIFMADWRSQCGGSNAE